MPLYDVTTIVTPGVLSTYYSADWGVDVDSVLERMDSAWSHYLHSGVGWHGSRLWDDGPFEPHPAELTFGGPLPYVEHLVGILEREGSFQTALVCNRFGPSGLPILHNGNHRAVASLIAGVPIHVNLYS